MYTPVDPKVDFPKQEEAVLRFWEDHDVFKKSVAQREGADEYVFFDGPPFATGLPHFGHFVPSTIKDIIPRYQTMKGKKVERRFGWDCHGLPVENLIEKELGLNSKTDIEKYGIAKFNEACRASVLRYVKEWRHTINRLGRWVDFDNDYKTMESAYMESIWWVMKQLWDKDLLYEGHYILPYCPRCSTVLSNHELNLGGYKDVHDPAITIRFKARYTVAGTSAAKTFAAAPLPPDTYLLAWTTTPWTLPSNLGLALGADIDYVLVADEGEHYILAESRLAAYYREPEKCTVIWKKKGAELQGICYEPLFPYFANLTVKEDGSSDDAGRGAFQTLIGDFVSTEDGTGIVHTAPGFGEEDSTLFKGSGIPMICPVDAECKFTAEVPDYQGRFVKDTDKDIMERLKAERKLVKRDQILHAYPHCWRCSSPLIYRAVSSWFVSVEKVKDAMLRANSKINWQPAHIKDGRFGKWLEGARDWAISRNRYWGNPLPIWKCSDPNCGHSLCVGSRDELKELSGVYPEDLHKHFVDKITIPCKQCGKTMYRVPEVLDCWFESGSMPFAQLHYPFENQAKFEQNYPADFIVEYIGQVRAWFYYVHAVNAALAEIGAFGEAGAQHKNAYSNVITTGVVAGNDGRKMSKSLGNFTDPNELMDKFSADSLRFLLLSSPLLNGEDFALHDKDVGDVARKLAMIWNMYDFFTMYAEVDGWEFDGMLVDPLSGKPVCTSLSSTETASAHRESRSSTAGDTAELAALKQSSYLPDVDNLNSRARTDVSDDEATIGTVTNPLDIWIISRLHELVVEVERQMDAYNIPDALSPILPFLDDASNWYVRRSRRRFWRSSKGAAGAEDDGDKSDAYRTLHYVLVRLSYLLAPFTPFLAEELYHNLTGDDESIHLKDWLPAGAVDEQVLADMARTRELINTGLSLRMKKDEHQESIKVRQPLQRAAYAGAKLAEYYEQIMAEELNVKEIRWIEHLDEYLTDRDAAEGAIKPESWVEIDKTITPELKREGLMREVIRHVQSARKKADLQVDDRIVLHLAVSSDDEPSAQLRQALADHADTIASETLATVAAEHPADALYHTTAMVGGAELQVSLAKA
mgnify:CR=1 FL=1